MIPLWLSLCIAESVIKVFFQHVYCWPLNKQLPTQFAISLKNHKQISQIPTQNTPAISTCKRVFGEHLQHKYMITVGPEMTAAIISSFITDLANMS